MKRLALVFAVLAVGGCTSAKKTALEKLGPEAQCVASSNDLAYCTLKGVGFICDIDDCVRAPDARTVLQLEQDRQRQADEDAAAAASQ